MKRLIFLMVLTLLSSLSYAALAPLLEVRALLANSTFMSVASPQAQTPRPMRGLPGLEEIRIWLGGSGTSFSFGPNHPALSVRLNFLDNLNFDMKPSGSPGNPTFVEAYDIFYSNADGTINTDGSYLTIEAVNSSEAQGGGGGNVAEIGLKFSGATAFEYGNTVASFVSLGSNADPGSIGRAIDGNTQTFTRLGNTVGQSLRLRITIGFRSSSNGAPCTYSITPTAQSFPSDGGSGTFRVIAPGGCPWYIGTLVVFSPPVAFVSLPSPREGYGNATLSYSVDANINPFRRSGTISIRETHDETAPAVQTFTVTQEPLSCPASAYSISPTDVVFDWDSSTQKITVKSPVGCLWSAHTNADWITLAPAGNTIDITVEKNEGAWRGGSISVAGNVIGVYQNSQHCSLEFFCRAFPAVCGLKPSSMLSLSRSFRDNTLVKTSRGRAYTETYYRFSPEAVQIMMLNPMLMLRSREIIERYKPVIQSMADGEQVTLTRGDLDEIDGFLDSFAAKGSPQLQQAIKGVCKDLRDPQVHSEFGITLTDGAKRELPTHPILQSAHGVGGSVVMGFGLAFVFFLARGRGKYFTPGARRVFCVMLAILLDGGQWSVARGQSKSSGQLSVVSGHLKDDARRLPITFEANQGQSDPAVRFISRGDGYSLFLAPTEAVIARARQKPKVKIQKWEQLKPATDHRLLTTDLLRMKLVGANSAARTTGLDELAGKTNYFIGKDSEGWRANVPTYARVKCEQVYPGVDMLYYGNQRELEYDFKVAPGADPRTINLRFDGAETIKIDMDGDLVISTAASEVRLRKPVAYQDVNGSHQEIPSRYIICNPQSAIRNQTVGFELGDYDATKPLIIDPVLAYSTYLGGSGDDEGNSIAVDSSGNLYIVGFTDSANFPTFGASQPALRGGQQDVFVAKLNPSGTQLIYSTYLGGDGQDNGSSIAVDSAGSAYITGFTNSTNFPVRNAMQPAKSGLFNAFVAKLDSTGSLVYSTHLGGSVGDYGSSIALDPTGNVYVAGVASSPNFPIAGALQQQSGGSADVYIAKLNPSGSQLVYSTYLGGAGDDGATGIAVDAAGSVYITGVTSSPNFRTASPLQAAHGGGLFDAFVARLNPSGTALVYCTYLGGSGEDRAFRIAVDSGGNAYITGDTDSTNFPTTGALQKSIGGSGDAFVARINASGSTLVYSTYLGGSGIDGGTAIAIDSNGSAYVTGFTGSTNFPTSDPLQQASGGGSFDAFVAKLNPSGTALNYSTYLGGAGVDAGFGIAVDSSGNAYLMGQTDSTNVPTASPLQPANGGGTSDVFIAKIAPASGLRIDSASVSGKKLLVFGSGFDGGAKILLNGDQQKTANDEQNPATALVAKKSGKNIAPGQAVTLQVRNADGTLSNEFSFTR